MRFALSVNYQVNFSCLILQVFMFNVHHLFLCLSYYPQEKVKEFGILKENMFAFWDVSIFRLHC